MKLCPHCQREVQDEAIKCRWCGKFFANAKPLPAAGPHHNELKLSARGCLILTVGIISLPMALLFLVIINFFNVEHVNKIEIENLPNKFNCEASRKNVFLKYANELRLGSTLEEYENEFYVKPGDSFISEGDNRHQIYADRYSSSLLSQSKKGFVVFAKKPSTVITSGSIMDSIDGGYSQCNMPTSDLASLGKPDIVNTIAPGDPDPGITNQYLKYDYTCGEFNMTFTKQTLIFHFPGIPNTIYSFCNLYLGEDKER